MDGPTWLQQLLTVGGPTLAVGLSAGFGLFKVLGPKLVDHRLNLRLERFKADRQTDLERLRQFLSGRVSRIHEKEFEVLPEAWFMMQVAHGAASEAVTPFLFGFEQRDITTLTDEELDIFLSKETFLSDIQKARLRKSADRKTYFRDARELYSINDALEKYVLFSNYLFKHSIFMTEDLYAKFRAVADDLSCGVQEYRIGKDADNSLMQEAASQKVIGVKAKIDDVGRAIQERLHYEEAELH